MTQTLSQLENSGAFIERHIGPDAAQQQEMLNAVGAQSLNALTGQIVPKDIQLATPPQVGAPATEYAALAELKAIASRNKRFTSYIGMGYTAVQLPPVILRNMLENPGWYTAYTPYQPEVSQGRLEALLNFQQVTLDLTGLDMASASLLDEATAAAEAMAMAKRVSKLKNANRFFVASDVHPQTLDVVRTRAETFGFEVIVDDAQKVLDLTEEIIHRDKLTAFMVTHNMKNAIRYGNRLIMMHEGRIIYDVSGEEKKNIQVADLLKKFENSDGTLNDRMLPG